MFLNKIKSYRIYKIFRGVYKIFKGAIKFCIMLPVVFVCTIYMVFIFILSLCYDLGGDREENAFTKYCDDIIMGKHLDEIYNLIV